MFRKIRLLRKIRSSLFDTLDSLLLMLAALLFLTLQVGCQQEEVTAEPTAVATVEVPTQEATSEPEQLQLPIEMDRPECDELDESPTAYPTTANFVDCQVILTGRAEEIQRVVDALLEAGLELESLGASDLGHLLGPDLPEISGELYSPVLDLAQAMSREEPGDQLLSALYRIQNGPGPSGAGEWVFEALHQVNDEHIGQIETVYADPNYLTGILTDSPCSNPFGATGSPFGATGSPFGATGSPSGGMGIGANPAQYREQPALDQIGVTEDETSPLDETDVKVLVGVLDTSPFAGTWPSASPATPITHVVPTLSFDVLEPPMTSTVTSVVTSTVPPEVIREHGVFVAGLVRAVAPGSDIQLVRVLSDWGCGDLFRLADGLNQFVRNVVDSADPRPVVINMSLGVAYPPSESEGFPAEIVALEAAVVGAHINGMIIVAAAGNDSTEAAEEEMNYPALYDEVIGVAAIDESGARSCFSNRGDVKAPGGDGNPARDAAGKDYCIAMAESCKTYDSTDSRTYMCSWGLTSVVSTRLAGVYPASNGYAYWAGTSFATPLVSGQAALLLSTGTTPDRARDAIVNTTVGGLINIPGSLGAVP